jgi:hypothetical protein
MHDRFIATQLFPVASDTPEELIEAMAKDSVVDGHYAGIDKANLTIGRLSEPLQAHVSVPHRAIGCIGRSGS